MRCYKAIKECHEVGNGNNVIGGVVMTDLGGVLQNYIRHLPHIRVSTATCHKTVDSSSLT